MFANNFLSAQKQLESFIPIAGKAYSKNRNFYRPLTEKQEVSLLSPAIRHRVINEKFILKKILGAHNYINSEKFIQEVFWRSYWKGWLELRPTVYHDYLQDRNLDLQKIRSNDNNFQNYNYAIEGKTKIACFDKWVSELKSFGYLHNHARMWFASIWIFTLDLPWSLGADFFMQHLLDGDPASNTLSWKWVAGIQTKGKNYIATSSNIKTFTYEKYFPENQLSVNPNPILSNKEYNIEQLNFKSSDTDTEKEYGLVIYADDIDICDIPFFNKLKIKSVYSGGAKNLSHDHDLSPLLSNFLDQMLKIKCAELCKEKDISYFYSEDDYYLNFKKWITDNNINNILVIRPTVGSWGKVHSKIKEISFKNDIGVSEIIKSFDSLIWPHATHGFFKFKQKIPKFLDEIDLLI